MARLYGGRMKYHAVEKGAVRFGSKDCGVAAVKRASSKSQGGDLAASERRHRAGGIGSESEQTSR